MIFVSDAKPAKAIRVYKQKKGNGMPPVRTVRPDAARRLQDMTLDERRVHLIPAVRAKRFKALERHIVRVLDAEPTITAEQRDALVALLRGEAR